MRLRLRFKWRLLLALMLGALAWWGVGWLLSAKPFYVLKYPAQSDPRKVQGAGWLKAHSFDREGHYLAIAQKGESREHAKLDIVDLPTGHVIGSHSLPGKYTNSSENDYEFEAGSINLTHLLHLQNGDGRGVAYINGLLTRKSDEPVRFCIWEWNVITNEKRLLLVPKYQNVSVKDGLTLVEETEIPLSSVLAPLGVLGVAAIKLVDKDQVGKEFRVGVTIYRFRSLPQLKERCVISLPSRETFTQRTSIDGRWLYSVDEWLPEPMTSAFRASSPPEENSRPTYVRVPKGVRIYDTTTGSLWYSLDGYPGYFLAAGYNPTFRTIFPFWYWPDEPAAQSQPQSEAEKRKRREELLAQVRSMNHRFFHIPSKTWLAVPEDIKGASFQEVPASQDGSVRWYASMSSLTGTVDVLETDPTGKTKVVARSIEVGGNADETLIAHSSQIAFHRPPKQKLPDWLLEQMHKIKFFNDWLKEEWDEIHVFDYEKGRDLWNLEMPRNDFLSLEATANHSALIINRFVGDHYEITVLALPLPSYSPWWARAAGLSVFLFCLLLLQRLRPKSKAVQAG